MSSKYSQSIFINCPFDELYLPLFHAMVFTIINCGFEVHCAKEGQDGGTTRIDRICSIISECKFGIHDISRTELDHANQLPRFNMPLELGLFLGSKRFGDDKQQEKVCLILDCEPYRFQKFISDIAGQDIKAHQNEECKVIKLVRNWLQDFSKDRIIPGGKKMLDRYELFRSHLPEICEERHLQVEDLTFMDFTNVVYVWLDLDNTESIN